jgi:hypothetical protein
MDDVGQYRDERVLIAAVPGLEMTAKFPSGRHVDIPKCSVFKWL